MLMILNGAPGVSELEAKILNVDVPALQKKLRAIGPSHAITMQTTELRYLPTLQMNGQSSLRLRQIVEEGNERVKLVLKYKLPDVPVQGHAEAGLKHRREVELELAVTGQGFAFEQTALLLQQCGLEADAYIESERIRCLLGDIRFDIDRILLVNGRAQRIPPYLEIEGPDADAIAQAAEKVGYSLEDLRPWSKMDVIRRHQDAVGHNQFVGRKFLRNNL